MRSPENVPTPEDRLVVKIDGATPETVDAQLALRLATSYLDLVVALAEEEGTDLRFTGIEILNQSVGVAVHASAPDVAREVSKRAVRCVTGEEQPPRGANNPTRSVREAIRHLPAQQKARVIVGPWARDLDITVAPSDLPADSSLSVRATLIRVGGTLPAARFESKSEEKSFTLKLSVELARDIGRYLYSEIDIVARVRRDGDGLIDGGDLEAFDAVTEDDATTGWRDWYRRHAGGWDEVKDIEVELGRHRD